jgi:hypothetical protein
MRVPAWLVRLLSGSIDLAHLEDAYGSALTGLLGVT